MFKQSVAQTAINAGESFKNKVMYTYDWHQLIENFIASPHVYLACFISGVLKILFYYMVLKVAYNLVNNSLDNYISTQIEMDDKKGSTSKCVSSLVVATLFAILPLLSTPLLRNRSTSSTLIMLSIFVYLIAIVLRILLTVLYGVNTLDYLKLPTEILLLKKLGVGFKVRHPQDHWWSVNATKVEVTPTNLADNLETSLSSLDKSKVEDTLKTFSSNLPDEDRDTIYNYTKLLIREKFKPYIFDYKDDTCKFRMMFFKKKDKIFIPYKDKNLSNDELNHILELLAKEYLLFENKININIVYPTPVKYTYYTKK